MRFYTSPAGTSTGNIVERMLISNDGNVSVGAGFSVGASVSVGVNVSVGGDVLVNGGGGYSAGLNRLLQTQLLNTGVGVGGTVVTRARISVANGAGGLVIVSGNADSGLAFAAVYVVAIRGSGTSSTEIQPLLLGRIGSAAPAISFSNSGGFLAVTIAPSGSNSQNVNLIGPWNI
jgi:hypothetical protein